jgi:RimJ/RimL family protein N-acetyltransferase
MLTVREMLASDIPFITNYWLNAEPAYLTGMGVDLNKMPTKEQWVTMLTEQLNQSYREKKAYCTIWEMDNSPIGHCNVNKIIFGEEAFMHLHLWYADKRLHGLGAQLVKKSLAYFFNNLQLKILYCEPYALNPAPNKTLPKAGFEFVKEYITVPGYLNFEQKVCLWQIKKEDFKETTTNCFICNEFGR